MGLSHFPIYSKKKLQGIIWVIIQSVKTVFTAVNDLPCWTDWQEIRFCSSKTCVRWSSADCKPIHLQLPASCKLLLQLNPEQTHFTACTLSAPAFSQFVSCIHLTSSPSLIFLLQTVIVGVCKWNPLLVSLAIVDAAVDNFPACLPTGPAWLPACRPACLHMWPVFHHQSARWQRRAQHRLQQG